MVAEKLAEELREAGYQTRTIKLSELIEETALEIGVSQEIDFKGVPLKRTEALQVAGSTLCERFGVSFLGGLAIRRLHTERQTNDSSSRQAFILDSLSVPKRSKLSAMSTASRSIC